MAKNIFYQFQTSIEQSMCLNSDKHSIKKTDTSDHRIFSFASRKELINFSHLFADYMKKEFPEVRKVKNINIEHINSFLGSRTGVTQATINHYVACINKLEKCCEKTFRINVDWKTDRQVPNLQQAEKLRSAVFSEKQIAKLKEYLSTRKDCYSKSAFYIAERFSLRSAEITAIKVKDVNIDSGILHIHESKGKRSRDIEMTKSDIEFMKKMIEGKEKNERLIPLKSDSVCAYLSRCCRHLNFENIVSCKSSYHALRKATIRRYYKEKIKEVGEKKAREMALQRLGHGSRRSDLEKIYLFD